MFYIGVGFLFLLISTIISSSSHTTKNTYQPAKASKTTIRYVNDRTDYESATSFLFQNGASKSQSRSERGIVLIDEDFDKLPYVGVRQGWSGEKTEPGEEMETIKENEKELLFTEEGSGSSVFQENTVTKFENTPMQLTGEKQKPTTSLESTIEGSGDISTFVPTTQEKELDFTKDSKLESCSNSTCDEKELTIQPGFAESVLENASLILLCSMNNHTDDDVFQWYRSNISYESLLQASISNHQLVFTIPNAKAKDSGTYMCVRISKQSCCHRELHVNVYKKPNYKYHLLIVGLVAAVSLFTCLLLVIHRRYKVKQFKKQLKAQIPLNEFLL